MEVYKKWFDDLSTEKRIIVVFVGLCLGIPLFGIALLLFLIYILIPFIIPISILIAILLGILLLILLSIQIVEDYEREKRHKQWEIEREQNRKECQDKFKVIDFTR